MGERIMFMGSCLNGMRSFALTVKDAYFPKKDMENQDGNRTNAVGSAGWIGKMLSLTNIQERKACPDVAIQNIKILIIFFGGWKNEYQWFVGFETPCSSLGIGAG